MTADNAKPDSELPNLGLLIRLLKLTTSSNDNEALVAIRKANEQLLKFGGDWERLLRGKVTVIGDPFADIPEPARSSAPPPPPRRAAPPPPTPTPPPPRAPVTPNPSVFSSLQGQPQRYTAGRKPKRTKPTLNDLYF